MSNFSFSHNVFFSSGNCIPIVHIFVMVSVYIAELEEPKIGMSGKGLTFSQTSPGFYMSAVQARDRTHDLPLTRGTL